MKQASEKAGRAEAGRRSSSLRTLTATELGDGSQVFSGGRGGASGRERVRRRHSGRGPENFVPFSSTPSPCGLVPLWIDYRLPPILLPPPLASGPSAVPKGGKRAALRVSNQPSGPATPPILQQPLPHRTPFVQPLSLPAPGWAGSAVSSPPESLGGRAGGCSPPPPPRRGSPRRGHPGAEANRPPPPACAICRLSASLRGPRSQAPAGVGSC